MDLTRHVEALRQQLETLAAAGGDESRALAERLGASLDPAVRVVLLDALSAAADEITLETAPTAVELRLRGGEPEFVVSGPPTGAATPPPSAATTAPPPAAEPTSDADEGGTSRITLRLPDQLKVRIEAAAGRQGVSVNSWLVRTVTDAVDGTTDRPQPTRDPWGGGQHITGWAR